MEGINHNPDKTELRKFGLIFAVFFVLFFGLLIPWIWDKPLIWQMGSPDWVKYVSGTFAGVALVFPAALGPVYKVWMKIGHALGWINTRIILGIIFFILFAPIALMFRIFGRDSMERKLDDSAQSYRKPSHHLARDRMEKPY